MFENVDGRTDGQTTDDGRQSHWYTNSSPRSLRLRWAKNSKWVWSGNTTINFTTKTLDRLVVIWASQKTLCCAFEQETSHILRSLYMKFEFNWPSGIQRRYLKMLTDGQPTKDTRVTGRLLAHPWAKNLVRTTLKKQLDPFPILLEGGTCGPSVKYVDD